MTNQELYYDDYPGWIVFTKNAVNIADYLVGALIMLGLGIWAAILYLIFAVGMQF